MKRKFLGVLLIILMLTNTGTADWKKHRYDPQNTGHYTEATIHAENLKLQWSYKTDGPIRSSPTTADIDNDRKKEIIVGSDDGSLYAIDYMGDKIWEYKTKGKIRTTPLIEDLDGDWLLEIIVGSDDGSLYAIDYMGNKIWEYKTKDMIRSSPTTADLDGDGILEIIACSTDGNIHILDTKGKLLKKTTIQGTTDSTPAITDLDGDGILEIITSSTGGIHILRQQKPEKTSLNTEKPTTTPAIINGKIIAASEDGTIYAIKYEEENIKVDWIHETKEKITTSPAVTDKVVTIGTEDKNQYIINQQTGELIKKYKTNTGIASSPVIAWIEGKEEGIIFGTDDGTLYLIDLRGEKIWSYQTGGAIKTTPAISDLNIDGKTEIITTSDDNRIYVFSSNGYWTTTKTHATTSTTTTTEPMATTTSTSAVTTTSTSMASAVTTTSTSAASTSTTLASTPPTGYEIKDYAISGGMALVAIVFIILVIIIKKGEEIS